MTRTERFTKGRDGPTFARMAEEPVVAGQNQSQRVRVGMIGLACVFLLVMLATALISLGGETDQPAANHAAGAQANEAAPREPLAELGVAPGAPTEAATAPATR